MPLGAAHATVTSYTTSWNKHPTGSAIVYSGGQIGLSTTENLGGPVASIVVNGSLLDLSTGAEVVDANGTRVGNSLTGDISNRKGGANASITIDVGGFTPTAGVVYRVLIHYLVETKGPDVVSILVVSRGTIAPTPALVTADQRTFPYAEVGVPYTVHVTGTQLQHAQVRASSSRAQITIVSRSATDAVYRLVYSGPETDLTSLELYDDRLGHVPNDDEMWLIRIGFVPFPRAVRAPVIAAVSPQPSNSTGTITVTGSNFTGGGLKLQSVFWTRRYGDGTVTAANVNVTPNSISFTAGADMSNEPLNLIFDLDLPSTAFLEPLVVPVPFSVIGAPRIDSVAREPNESVRAGVRVLMAGSLALVGRHLFVERPNASTALLGGSNSTVTLGGISLTPTARAYVKPLRDTLTVTVPATSDNVSGPITVTTAGGTFTTTERFLLATVPRVTGVSDVSNASAAASPVTNATLQAGRSYAITGNALSLVHQGTLLQRGTVALNGRLMPSLDTNSPNTELRFTVPNDATSGALSVHTDAGTTTVRTFTVAAPTVSATPHPVSVTAPQSSTPSGAALRGTVQLDMAGSAAAGFAVALSSSDTNIVQVAPASLPMSGASAEFLITPKTVATPQRATITAKANDVLRTLDITVTPAIPTFFAVSSNDVISGATGSGRITFSGAPAPNTTVSLSSSDPAVVVPATFTATGQLSSFAFTTTESPTPRTVTLSATANGATQTTTVTVTPVKIATLTVNQPANGTSPLSPGSTPPPVRVGADGTLELTLARAASIPITFTLATDNPTIQFSQPTLIIPANQLSGTIGLHLTSAPPAESSVTITASRTVVTAGFGPVTISKTARFKISP